MLLHLAAHFVCICIKLVFFTPCQSCLELSCDFECPHCCFQLAKICTFWKSFLLMIKILPTDYQNTCFPQLPHQTECSCEINAFTTALIASLYCTRLAGQKQCAATKCTSKQVTETNRVCAIKLLRLMNHFISLVDSLLHLQIIDWRKVC